MAFFPERYPHVPKYLTQTEVQALFAVISSARDRALFALIYHYGLRVSEVGLLRRGDVDFDRDRIIVKRVKGGAWSERPLFAATRDLLLTYLGQLPGSPAAPLFPGRSGPLRKRQIQELFERYRKLSGVSSHATCHSLRHSIATHLLDAGVSLQFVQDHLGHQRIESTTIYARITSQHRLALFRRLEESPWIVYPGRAGPAAKRGKETS